MIADLGDKAGMLKKKQLQEYAHVAELVDAHGSGPCAFGCGGSSPSVGTTLPEVTPQKFAVVQSKSAANLVKGCGVLRFRAHFQRACLPHCLPYLCAALDMLRQQAMLDPYEHTRQARLCRPPLLSRHRRACWPSTLVQVAQQDRRPTILRTNVAWPWLGKGRRPVQR